VDFQTFVRIMRSRWKLLVTAVVTCLVAAVAITVVQTKSYQATATVMVSFTGAATINDAYEAIQAAQQRLSSYAELAGGRTVAQRTIDQLGVPMTADQLVDSTKVQYTPESTLFRLTVSDSDPQQAAALASAMALQFAVLVPEVDAGIPVSQPAGQVLGSGFDAQQTLAGAKATVVEQPIVPQSPQSPVPARNVALGLLAGVLLGIALALGREATDRTIRSRETLTARSGLPTLAQLPSPDNQDIGARRGGGRAKPCDLVFDEEVRRMRTTLLGSATTPVRSVLVTAPTLDQGATTTALHLALSFTEIDETVLLVEGDPRQPTIAGIVGVDANQGLMDVLADQLTLDDAVRPTPHAGLWVLASSKPTGFQRKLSTPSLVTMLEKLSASFDRVVIDGPPALVTADAGIFAAAVDATVLVVRSGQTAAEELDGALENLRPGQANIVGTVLTGARVPRHTKEATSAYRAKVNESTSATIAANGS
jgi:tyrosine-protein kinase